MTLEAEAIKFWSVTKIALPFFFFFFFLNRKRNQADTLWHNFNFLRLCFLSWNRQYRLWDPHFQHLTSTQNVHWTCEQPLIKTSSILTMLLIIVTAFVFKQVDVTLTLNLNKILPVHVSSWYLFTVFFSHHIDTSLSQFLRLEQSFTLFTFYMLPMSFN